MWDKLYEASKKSPFRSPFISAQCADAGKRDPSLFPLRNDIKFGTAEYFMFCGMGGALACGLTHLLVTPLDVVKCRAQTNPEKYPGMLKGLKVTIAEEGYRGLVRGWAPTLWGYSFQGSGKFGLYEVFKVQYAKFFSQEDAYKYRTFIYLAASATAEFLADIVLCPFEAVKVKIQTTEDYGKTMRECIPKMIQEEGFGSFYRPIVPLWLRQMPYTMMKFVSFERTIELIYKNVLKKKREECSYGEQLAVTFASGYIAGILCTVVSHPADTLVSKMNQERGCTLLQTLRLLGFKGVWHGLLPRTLMIGTLTGLQWFIYDAFKVICGIPRPPIPTSKSGKK